MTKTNSVFCWYRGKVVFLKVSEETLHLLEKAKYKMDEPPHNLIVMAFNQCGVSESAIKRYLNEKLKKLH